MNCYNKPSLLCGIVLLLAMPVFSNTQPPPFDENKAQQAAQVSDPAEATRAYLDSVPVERKEKTRSYAHGNYVLDLSDFAYSSLVLIGLLAFGVSAKLRTIAQRMTRFRPLQTATYWIQFLVLTTLLGFPFTLYRSYFREKEYGLLTQAFGPWMIDQLKALALGCVFGAIFLMFLYGVLRRTPRTWWLWGSGVMIAFIILLIAIAPVYISPIFNKFTPVKNVEIRENILGMAKAQGIPADEVYEMDASKRTDRISAYVAGMLGTMRIVMFDNTLKRCTPQEIQMIMGHEMGHYVLNHVWKAVAFFSVLIVLGFLVVRWGFHRFTASRPSWQIQGVPDTAGFPLLILLLTAFLFITGPVTNTFSRTQEDQADDFGLNASRQPDAAATTFLKLGEYRELDPHPVIEFLLFDHPSGGYRIRNAMKWKQDHP